MGRPPGLVEGLLLQSQRQLVRAGDQITMLVTSFLCFFVLGVMSILSGFSNKNNDHRIHISLLSLLA